MPLRLLVWVGHPPFSTSHLSEAVRVVAMATALDVETDILFTGDGVRAWAAAAEPYRLGPSLAKLLQGLVSDDRPALIDATSLTARRLRREDLAGGVPYRLVSTEEVAARLLAADRVVPL